MPRYHVVWDYEIDAATPAQAATVARNRMLDPDEHHAMDVYPVIYVAEADDRVPGHSHGWHARFEDAGVRPSLVFAQRRLDRS
jgi:hypothetical protein